jgi:predicted hydrocarbon binding protein
MHQGQITFMKWNKYDMNNFNDRRGRIKMSENSILDEMIYDQSSGSLHYKGVRYLLIRPETIAGFQKPLVESCGQQAEDQFFAGGHAGGSLSAQKYKQFHNFSDIEIIEFMMNMGNQIGWGHFSLDRYDPAAKYLCVSVRESPFAQAYGKSARGVCHLIRGVLAGMAGVLFAGDCTADEVKCLAKGDACCRFEITAKG